MHFPVYYAVILLTLEFGYVAAHRPYKRTHSSISIKFQDNAKARLTSFQVGRSVQTPHSIPIQLSLLSKPSRQLFLVTLLQAQSAPMLPHGRQAALTPCHLRRHPSSKPTIQHQASCRAPFLRRMARSVVQKPSLHTPHLPIPVQTRRPLP